VLELLRPSSRELPMDLKGIERVRPFVFLVILVGAVRSAPSSERPEPSIPSQAAKVNLGVSSVEQARAVSGEVVVARLGVGRLGRGEGSKGRGTVEGDVIVKEAGAGGEGWLGVRSMRVGSRGNVSVLMLGLLLVLLLLLLLLLLLRMLLWRRDVRREAGEAGLSGEPRDEGRVESRSAVCKVEKEAIISKILGSYEMGQERNSLAPPPEIPPPPRPNKACKFCVSNPPRPSPCDPAPPPKPFDIPCPPVSWLRRFPPDSPWRARASWPI
jgi:hypothetical protein